jgi:uncharacterized membrane protein
MPFDDSRLQLPSVQRSQPTDLAAEIMGNEAPPSLNYATPGIAWPPVEEPYAQLKKRARDYGKQTILWCSIIGGFSLADRLGILGPKIAPTPKITTSEILNFLPEGLVYLVLLWWGIGSYLLRRWVRPIALVLGSMVCLFGIFGAVAEIFMIPAIFKSPSAQSQGSLAFSGTFLGFLLISMLFGALLFIVLPARIVTFYRKPEVKAMLEHYDPVPRWTDERPLPLLATAFVLFIFACIGIANLPQAIADSHAGTIVEIGKITFFSGQSIVAMILAWLVLRARPMGWWGTIAYLMAFGLYSLCHGAWLGFVFEIAPIGWLLYIRKYFRQPPVISAGAQRSQ